MIRILFSIVLLFSLYACKKSSIEPGNKIALRTISGKYVCADRFLKSNLNGNREGIGPWEVFKLKESSTGIYITDFENNPICVDANNVVWRNSEDTLFFQFPELENHRLLISYYNDTLSSVNSDILLGSGDPVKVLKLPSKNIFGGYLSNFFIAILLIAFVIFYSLYVKFESLKERTVYYVIILCNILLSYAAITELSFLTEWDEQFHALVGKNLSLNPFIPQLYINTNYHEVTTWTNEGIWLHKQPVFLYQIALSIFLFGKSLIAVRLPSMILFSILGVFIYRIGTIVFYRRIGLIASMLFSFLGYKLVLLSGIMATDHNDVSFLFYITSSIWALLEYYNSKKKKYLVLIIVFASFAVLTKWLLGFLVFVIWGVIIIFSSKNYKVFVSSSLLLLKNFLISAVIVSIWQIYIFCRFPKQAKEEFILINKHLTEPMENHGGDWFYHFNMTDTLYNIPFLIVFSFIIISSFYSNNKRIYFSLFLGIGIVYLLYSIAATKMISFTFVASGVVIVLISGVFIPLHKLTIKLIKHNNYIKLSNHVFLITAIVILLNIELLEKKLGNETDLQYYQLRKENAKARFKNLNGTIKQKVAIFNCGNQDHIRAMFWVDNSIAYNNLPNEKTLTKLINDKFQVIVFNDLNLPTYILNNPDVVLIDNY